MSTIFRSARREDLEAVVRMLSEDTLGSTREDIDGSSAAYHAAFDAIEADANNDVIVADCDGRVAGVLQLTFVPNLTHRGGWRAQIEGVRVAADQRSRGLGAELLKHAIERARSRGCVLVQLTSDKRRDAAIRFYERLGFEATHEGMKLFLRDA